MGITWYDSPDFQVTVRLHHRRFRRRGRNQRRRRKKWKRTKTRRQAVLPKRPSQTLKKSRKQMVIRPRLLQLRLPLLNLKIVREANLPWHALTSDLCSLAAPKLEEEARKIRLPPGKYLSILNTDSYDKREP